MDWLKDYQAHMSRGNVSTTQQGTVGWSCNCVGPRPGEPVCPCKMVNVIERNGRWVRKEQDLGPVTPVRTQGSSQ